MPRLFALVHYICEVTLRFLLRLLVCARQWITAGSVTAHQKPGSQTSAALEAFLVLIGSGSPIQMTPSVDLTPATSSNSSKDHPPTSHALSDNTIVFTPAGGRTSKASVALVWIAMPWEANRHRRFVSALGNSLKVDAAIVEVNVFRTSANATDSIKFVETEVRAVLSKTQSRRVLLGGNGIAGSLAIMISNRSVEFDVCGTLVNNPFLGWSNLTATADAQLKFNDSVDASTQPTLPATLARVFFEEADRLTHHAIRSWIPSVENMVFGKPTLMLVLETSASSMHQLAFATKVHKDGGDIQCELYSCEPSSTSNKGAPHGPSSVDDAVAKAESWCAAVLMGIVAETSFGCNSSLTPSASPDVRACFGGTNFQSFVHLNDSPLHHKSMHASMHSLSGDALDNLGSPPPLPRLLNAPGMQAYEGATPPAVTLSGLPVVRSGSAIDECASVRSCSYD